MTQLDRLTYELRHLTTASPVNTRRCEHEVIFFFLSPLHVQQQYSHSGREKGSRDGPGAAGFDRRRPTTSSALFWAEMKDGEGPRVEPGRAMAPGECKVFFSFFFCGCKELPEMQRC